MTDSVKTRLFRPLDAILLAALATAGILLSWTLFAAPMGERATVWIDGRRAAWFPLDGAPRLDSVRGALGTIVIQHGEGTVRILRSPCPGRLCIRQGAARRAGEKLVCVPSRVVVTVEGGSSGRIDLDAVH